MPYSDPEKRRAYDRQRRRRERAGLPRPTVSPTLPLDVRIRTAEDVLALMEEQVGAVRADEDAGSIEKARCVGYLASIALRAVEVADVSARVEALENALKARKRNGR